MKKAILSAFLLTVSLAGIAQTINAGDNAEKKCVEKTLANRSIPERIGAAIVPGVEKIQHGTAEKDCKNERILDVINNKENQFIEKHK